MSTNNDSTDDDFLTPRAAAENCPKCNRGHSWSTDDYDQERGCDDCSTVWHSCASGNLAATGHQDDCTVCNPKKSNK